MNEKNSALGRLFVEHHRQFTKGLHGILQFLQDGDVSAAAQEADRIDRLAGPHLEFEERFLYPEVAKARGSEFADLLYAEHKEGQSALKAILRLSGDELLDSREQERLIAQLQIALDHAGSCGTLLSHLTTLEMDKQNQYVEQIHAMDRLGHRWTELPNFGGCNERPD